MEKDTTITLEFLRDKTKINYPLIQLTGYDENWYIPLNIKHTQESTIQIWEDKSTVLSIIESIWRFKLIIFKDVDLGYLKDLADQWCVPEPIQTLINDKIKETDSQQIYNNFTTFLDNQISYCSSCSTSFKIKENQKDSCKGHRKFYDMHSLVMSCCGATNYHSSYCRIGYHTINYMNIEKYAGIFLSLKNSEKIT